MKDRRVDAAFLRGMTERRLSRRDVFRISGLSATAIGLAACGVKGQNKVDATPLEEFWKNKVKNGKVSFANWPLYMDPEKPELKSFTDETGIQVSYDEVIEEMPAWFAKVQPQLSAKQSIGYDLMVITNGAQFKQFVDLNFLAPLDHTKLPNYAANAAPAYKKTSYDNGNVYSVPWASGMTGIAYNPDKVGPITKLADLWDPKYKGMVGMFTDPQELANFGLLKLGIDPAKSTKADWQKAADELKKQKDAGMVRNYYDQSYIDALASGEVAITQAWSGDIYQRNLSDGTNLQFVIPEEGATIWTDNMAIPYTAENPVDAIMLMDYFYKTDIAGSLAEYINYVTPVPGAKQVILADADKADNDEDKQGLKDLAESPLVFPDDATYAKLHYYVEFPDTATAQEFNALFEPIIQS
jgi:spermidine/putrescine transport system substrate-binding protein